MIDRPLARADPGRPCSRGRNICFCISRLDGHNEQAFLPVRSRLRRVTGGAEADVHDCVRSWRVQSNLAQIIREPSVMLTLCMTLFSDSFFLCIPGWRVFSIG
jgi:hypothetical protein